MESKHGYSNEKHHRIDPGAVFASFHEGMTDKLLLFLTKYNREDHYMTMIITRFFMYLNRLDIFLWFRTSGLTGYLANWVFTVVAIISFLCQYRLYRLNTTRIASAPDKEIDERQKAVRNQAYRRAYQISIWIVLITLSLILVTVYLNPIPGGFLLPAIGLLWSMLLLPTWVVAWTERDN